MSSITTTTTSGGVTAITHRRPRRRTVRSLLAAFGIVLMTALGLTATAPAANAAATLTTPILLVHGYDLDAIVTGVSRIDCRDAVMTEWKRELRSRGFTNVLTVGWYRSDINCDLVVPGRGDNTINTSIDQIGREFANLVFQRFGLTQVAISAHSLGGLVVRRALHGVQDNHADFPASLNVSDVVTSGTPHGGAAIGALCGIVPPGIPVPLQCRQTAPGSAFLNALADNPQTDNGTDWTLTGSECDLIVSANSALDMARVSTARPAITKVRFRAPTLLQGGCLFGAAAFSHDELVTETAPVVAIRNGLLTGS